MASIKLTLSVPEQIFKQLDRKKKDYAYASVQELIIEMLRDQLYYKKKKKTETRGRPKKIREEKIITRKKIFSKKGEPISV